MDHPLAAAVVAGGLLLLFTGAIVDRYLRRRESRRWNDVGLAAAMDLGALLNASFISLIELVGVDPGGRVWSEIELDLRPARERAVELFPTSHQDAVSIINDKDRIREVVQQRLPGLLADEHWGDTSSALLWTLIRSQTSAMSRWLGIFATIGDDAGFDRVAQSTSILERSNELMVSMYLLQNAEGADVTRHVDRAITCWTELLDAYETEARFWGERFVSPADFADLEEHHPATGDSYLKKSSAQQG